MCGVFLVTKVCWYVSLCVCVSVCVVDGCNSDESYEWGNDALVKSTKKH